MVFGRVGTLLRGSECSSSSQQKYHSASFGRCLVEQSGSYLWLELASFALIKQEWLAFEPNIGGDPAYFGYPSPIRRFVWRSKVSSQVTADSELVKLGSSSEKLPIVGEVERSVLSVADFAGSHRANLSFGR